MNKVILFAIYISVSLLGLYKLKSAEFGLNVHYLSGMTFYILGFFLWLLVLRWFPLSIAFPVAAGTLIVGTQLIGTLALNEHSDAISIFGVSLILVGILILGTMDYLKSVR